MPNPADLTTPTPCPVAGLYVHVPFCETKCGYCDFYSIALQGRPTRPLVNSLQRELGVRVPAAGHVIRTVFVGGGTPTLLPPAELTSLLEEIGRHAPPTQLAEFTVEANPATVQGETAKRLVDAGVSRVSLGAQSFAVSELATLERLHSPDDIAPSVETLRAAGISQLNLDLIFGIPGQTVASWGESLRRALELEIDHVACYGLTYEPATAMTARRDRGMLKACDEELEAAMYQASIDTLTAAGFVQYEISNFARPGFESKHNLMYWRNEPYIGIGPSAAGCYANRRYKNVPEVGRYVSLVAAGECTEIESEQLDAEKTALEMILMQFRLNEGLSLSAFERRTGATFAKVFGGALPLLIGDGYLIVTQTHARLTDQGRRITNWVLAELAGSLEGLGPMADGGHRLKPIGSSGPMAAAEPRV